jgi:hypothetical protein
LEGIAQQQAQPVPQWLRYGVRLAACSPEVMLFSTGGTFRCA